jgi:hypothetical protein
VELWKESNNVPRQMIRMIAVAAATTAGLFACSVRASDDR